MIISLVRCRYCPVKEYAGRYLTDTKEKALDGFILGCADIGYPKQFLINCMY
jgi:hypothetical protein